MTANDAFIGIFFLGLVAGLIWFVVMSERRIRQREACERDAQRSSDTGTLLTAQVETAPATTAVPLPPSINESFLNDVRGLSCYQWLRDLHGFITGGAILACIVLWIVLLNVAGNTAARIYGSIVCGVLIVGLFIERGLFTLLVDAADVLVDIGRHTRANAEGRAEPPKDC